MNIKLVQTTDIACREKEPVDSSNCVSDSDTTRFEQTFEQRVGVLLSGNQ